MSLTATDLEDIRGIVRDEVKAVVRDEVKVIVRDEVRSAVDVALKPVKDELEAMRNDIKEIYFMILNLEKRVSSLESRVSKLEGSVSKLESSVSKLDDRMSRIERYILPEKEFQKLSLEQKLLKLNSELLAAAKQAGVTLPRT